MTLMKSHHPRRERHRGVRQFLFMRVALGIHGDDSTALRHVPTCSPQHAVHAAPTLLNAGTDRAQMSSCYLNGHVRGPDHGIYDTLKECARISAMPAVSVGVQRPRQRVVHQRHQRLTVRPSSPWQFNATARYVNQGSARAPSRFIDAVARRHRAVCDLSAATAGTHRRDRSRPVLTLGARPFMQRVEAGGVGFDVP
jgi:ribonucleotide reductase alpha subunit